MPNILLLTIDALRCDRMSLHGYSRSTTPNLDRLATQSIVCDRNSSLAAFTQASFPTIMTSTRPLSYGGYDNGTLGRPATVLRACHDAGWHVTLLSSFKWITRFFGYGDGVDSEVHLFSPVNLMGMAFNRMKSSVMSRAAGALSEDEMLALVTPVMDDLFVQLDAYCVARKSQGEADHQDFGDTRLVRDGFDFHKVQSVVHRHRAAFAGDPRAYMRKHFATMPEAHGWLAEEWRYCRKWSRLAEEAAFRAGNALVGVVDKRAAILRANRLKPFVDGAALADRVIRLMRDRDRSKPFLICTHFLDTHLPYAPGRGSRWYKSARDYLRPLGYGDEIDISAAVTKRPRRPDLLPSWSAMYDAALRYVDEQIGRIVAALDEPENTIVVICGDHGEELGEHGNYSHYFRLHHHNTWVPLIFIRPGSQGMRVDGLTSLLDLAPTLAHLAGAPAIPGWEGAVVTSSEVAIRQTMVMETFYGGNCLFDHRPVYMAARDRRMKLIWKEAMDPDDRFGPMGNELYDLDADPLEQVNLYRPDHDALPVLERAVAGRLAEIPQFGRARLARAFPAFAKEMAP
ncbi:sulfatase-like hydrolase/transferase [Magnetospirillum gryphiswaldense]|uniref:sulfatase-like hydrolase/transferase n=1 Tax=Magnetospirillum gryphiswaldense TaxID=55518 RepID=UPI000AFE3471|nr:sulfatase-like hydrolase/transferase [Magnetospirillum gryphiswaldense]